MHVAAFTIGDFHGVDDLSVWKRSEGDDVHGLSETASEERGTVYAWQDGNLRTERTDLIKFAAVRTDIIFNDGAADFMMNS